MNKPVCTVCNRSGNGVEFSVFPMTKGFKFGEICTDCDKENHDN